jgi:cold shock CspA family protein
MKGTVFNIERDRGFAFIRDENNASRFVHAKDFRTPLDFDFLYEGQTVEFTPLQLIPGDPGYKGNGLRAKDVVVCSSSNAR